MEAKYHQGKVPTTELSKTITQNVSSVDNLITNDVRITGNASQALPELRWEPIYLGGNAESPMNTEVMIILESIYHGRNSQMYGVYHDT